MSGMIVFGGPQGTEKTLEQELSLELTEYAKRQKIKALQERDLGLYLRAIATLVDVKNPTNLEYFVKRYNPEQQAQEYKDDYMNAEAIVKDSEQEAENIRAMLQELPEEATDSNTVQIVIQQVPGRNEQDIQYKALARFPKGVQWGNSEIAPYTEETKSSQIVYLEAHSPCVTHALQDLARENTVLEVEYKEKNDAVQSIDTGNGRTIQYTPGVTSPSDYVMYALHGGFTAGQDISFPIPQEFVQKK